MKKYDWKNEYNPIRRTAKRLLSGEALTDGRPLSDLIELDEHTRKCLAVKLHDKINRIAALALAVAKPLVSPDGQAVMFFPTVFPSAFDKCLSLCAEKIFQTDGVCPVDLCLGVLHGRPPYFLKTAHRLQMPCSRSSSV